MLLSLVVLLGAACKVEPAAETKWTVTIDPMGMALGGTLTISVSDGGTATLPSDYSIPTDYEIPYYSTEKNNPDKPFEFGTTKVTSDITVYPHFRYQADKVVKNISGAWLNTSVGTFELAKNEYIYKFSDDNAFNGYCFAGEVGTLYNLDLEDSNNSSVLTDLINLPVTPKSVDPLGQTVDSRTYNGKTIQLVCTYFPPIELSYNSNDSDILKVKSSKFFNYGGSLSYELELKDARNLNLTYIESSIVKNVLLKKVN